MNSGELQKGEAVWLRRGILILAGLAVGVFLASLQREDQDRSSERTLKPLAGNPVQPERTPAFSVIGPEVSRSPEPTPGPAVVAEVEAAATVQAVEHPGPAELLPEMKELLESPSMARAPAQTSRRRLEASAETAASRDLQAAMNLALELNVRTNLTRLVTCRDAICELQIVDRKMDAVRDGPSLSDALEVVDQEMMSRGMVRQTQAVVTRPGVGFTVAYWVPRGGVQGAPGAVER